MPTITDAAVARLVVRSLNRRSGMTGSTATRASTYTVAASRARPSTTSSTEMVEPQAKLLPASETQTSSTETPPIRRVAPR